MAPKKKLQGIGESLSNKLQDIGDSIEEKTDKAVTTTKPEKISEPPKKPFKKPNSDYYRLDMISRAIVGGKTVETIRTNYKEYVETMASSDGISITKYIQNLIDADMRKPKNRQKFESLKNKK